ncbi:hypothetical protein H261_07763 [Paramagnetospirillum caucaseum]|uniref:Uncharacterized protein n=1 Tax=Paramagnetospirillum caucaseum TaxID=1244869 RepID=M3ADD1_9PROT|nr:hypothetical protein H261_07763 [Paramagnetospirillum caucaseum]
MMASGQVLGREQAIIDGIGSTLGIVRLVGPDLARNENSEQVTGIRRIAPLHAGQAGGIGRTGQAEHGFRLPQSNLASQAAERPLHRIVDAVISALEANQGDTGHAENCHGHQQPKALAECPQALAGNQDQARGQHQGQWLYPVPDEFHPGHQCHTGKKQRATG